MKKKDYVKINPRLCEEIKRYGKIKKVGSKNVKYPVFLSEIPYKGFMIILAHPMPPKELEEFYYSRTKYGWWCFCASKNELDKWDKKLLDKSYNQYGTYREGEHSFCNDNQQDNRYINDLHPDEMITDLKQQITIFYRDKQILKDRENMTKKDHERIKKKAKDFFDSVITKNSNSIKKTQLKTHNYKNGWVISGQKNNYFMDEDGKSYIYNPKKTKHMLPLCIMPKWNNKYIHQYDHMASLMLALLNDSKTKKFIHTINVG